MSFPVTTDESDYVKPPSYDGISLVAMLFFFSPFGWIASHYGNKVDELWNAGDRDGARSASTNARLFAWLGIGLPLAAAAIILGPGVYFAVVG